MDERKLYEAWCGRLLWEADFYSGLGKDNPPTAWDAWQARAALASSPSQPAGWKPLPVEPTMLMYDAWVDAQKNGHDDGVFGTWIAAYKAMCAAAPALGEGEK